MHELSKAPRGRKVFPRPPVDAACIYCGKVSGWRLMCYDHVIPLSRGGDDDMHNLAPCCHMCNTKKRNRIPTEWRKDLPEWIVDLERTLLADKTLAPLPKRSTERARMAADLFMRGITVATIGRLMGIQPGSVSRNIHTAISCGLLARADYDRRRCLGYQDEGPAVDQFLSERRLADLDPSATVDWLRSHAEHFPKQAEVMRHLADELASVDLSLTSS